jgi:hypothetical protein
MSNDNQKVSTPEDAAANGSGAVIVRSARKRHRYNDSRDLRGYGANGSIVACIHCGTVREYIAGAYAYFKNDTSYSQSPPCDG